MKKINTDTELGKIIAAKKIYLEKRKSQKPYSQLEAELQSLRSFEGPSLFDALKSKGASPKIIAEVKKASPSRGVIRDNFSLEEINDAYQNSENVVAISVLTETDHFQGSEEVLSFFISNNKNKKPLLRKDFIFDPYQILETKVLGAQGYLLIASLFETAQELDELIKQGDELGLDALVEVHTPEELAMVKQTSARIIGVNCRDMKTFKINLDVHKLLQEVDESYARVAESGIDTPEYLKDVSSFADASLIGSHFMSQDNIENAIKVMVKS
jgi:indole-3-glycerol phosphate synthase